MRQGNQHGGLHCRERFARLYLQLVDEGADCAVLKPRVVTWTEGEINNPAPFVAEHVSVMPGVSAVTVVVLHPDEDAIPDWAPVTFQVTVTLLFSIEEDDLTTFDVR